MVLRIPPESLYRQCDFSQLGFQTTNEIAPLTSTVGQERATEALKFGLEMPHKGYNIFVFGSNGCGKQSISLESLNQIARTRSVPTDWCYLNNFTNSQKPIAVEFSSGRGRIFKADMDRLVEELCASVVSAVKGKELDQKRREINEDYKNEQQKLLDVIHDKAFQQSILLLETPTGFVFAPALDGEVLNPDQFEKLPPERKEFFINAIQILQRELEESLKKIQELHIERRAKIRKFTEQTILQSTIHLMEAFRQKYADIVKVQEYLKAMQVDVLEHIDDFYIDQRQSELLTTLTQKSENLGPLRRYQVNLLIDHGEDQAAPVIFEDTPNIANLVGSIEHLAKMGALITDFMMIKPGALHRANGGYLLIDAYKLFMYPQSWEILKKSLKSEQIKIESLSEIYSFAATTVLEPEPIPLNVKLVLFGPEWLYYLLTRSDPEFEDLFKIGSDFDEDIEWNVESETLYARFIALMVKREGLRPFTHRAVARVIEQGARLAGYSDKLTVQFSKVVDLLREANQFSESANKTMVDSGEVQAAIDFQIRRANRIHQRLLEETLRETLLIETEGRAVGRVNGLSVYLLGGSSFGHPARISARVRMGENAVLDIQREIELGGAIHSKGVLILSGYISGHYAIEMPLSFSASLVFEQTYGEVDGDSASLAEAVALLSAIANVPVLQSIAITGSMNQHGEVQAIGGVNAKIEGFFELCKRRGLKGDQGVVIPKGNIKNLMLRSDIAIAVREKQFHIFAVESIDECLELLADLPAGIRSAAQRFPSESFNGKVEERLTHFALKRVELYSKRTAVAFKNEI